MDHGEGGRTRLDVEFAWADTAAPVPVTPDEEIMCDVSAGYVCARDACSVLWHDGAKWWPIGETHMLAQQDGMLLEYDTATFAPTGATPPPPPSPMHARPSVGGAVTLLHAGLCPQCPRPVYVRQTPAGRLCPCSLQQCMCQHAAEGEAVQ